MIGITTDATVDAPARSARPDPTFGQTMTAGILWTTAVFFLATAIGCLAVSADVTFALAIGGFAALWGGPGFGVMVGGTMWFLAEQRRNSDAA